LDASRGHKHTYILGINSAYHEPAACLLADGEVVAAVEEERFNRFRHGKHALIDNPHHLPHASIDYCLGHAGITMQEVAAIGFSFLPEERLKNIGVDKEVVAGDWGSEEGERKFYNLIKTIPALLSERHGVDVSERFVWLPHHTCHAASAFFPSPYEEAAILSMDGIGEFSPTLLAYGEGRDIYVLKQHAYPNSIGFLWTKASRFLSILVDGMGEYGAGKVMALAAYGRPERFYNTFTSFIHWDEATGEVAIDGDVVEFRSGSHERYEQLFGMKAREAGEPMRQCHADFAAALQKLTNDISLALARYLHRETRSENLCRAGGVALNCISNTHVLASGPFKRMFVEPAANDMGTAIGAALYIWHARHGNKRKWRLSHVYLGPEYSEHEIAAALKESGLEYTKVKHIERVAAYLLAQGFVLGWFQGRMEFGPRALGNRSILADPRRAEMHRRVSIEIKEREPYRPLAPSVLAEFADAWFERPKGGSDSDGFMIFSYKVKEEKAKLIPAVTHVDGTARLQVVEEETNPRFYGLIKHFYELTGVPMLINTSFNIRKPIVATPQHALEAFAVSKIDILAMGDYLVVRKGEHDARLYSKYTLELKKFFEYKR